MSHLERALGTMGASVTKQDQRLLDKCRNTFSEKKDKAEDQNPSMSSDRTTVTPPAVNDDEDSDSPYVERMPIINPPDGCTDKVRLPCDYQPLPTPTSIRLVRLHLIRDYRNYDETQKYQRIRCSTVVCDLATMPDYFALSYTWGDPRTLYTDKRDIYPPASWAAPAFEVDCDGRPVTVATNLYTALVSIRSSFSAGDLATKLGPAYVPQEGPLRGDPEESGGAVYLWIDALCINQDDLAEKGRQVPLMDRIYAQARVTFMWLGGGEALATVGTFESVRKLEALTAYLDNDDDRCRSINITRPEMLTALGLEPLYPRELIGLYLLLSRSWFSRAWVVQEWVLSRSCVFLCGNVAIGHRALTDLMNDTNRVGWLAQIHTMVRCNIVDTETGGIPAWFNNPAILHRTHDTPSAYGQEDPETDAPALYRAPWANSDPGNDMYGLVSIAAVLRLAQGYDSASQVPVSQQVGSRFLRKLGFSVETFRGAKATDPRDKVFAFHGLFKDDQGRPAYPPPDYTKTVAQVYTDAALVMGGTLGPRFLVFTGDTSCRGAGEHGLPSWVPDLSQAPSHHFLQDSPIFAAAAGLGEPNLWAGVLAREPEDERGSTSTSVINTINAIQLRGCHIDTIVHVQEQPVGAGNLADGFRSLHQLLSHLPEVSRIALPVPRPHVPREPSSDGLLAAMTAATEKAYPMEDPCRPTAWSEQDRFQVLWRTLVKDYDSNAGAHPASASLGEQHMRRLHAYLHLQILLVQLSVVKQLLEQILQEAAAQVPDQSCHDSHDQTAFLAQFVAQHNSEDSWLKHIVGLLPHLLHARGMESGDPLCYEDQVSAIRDINIHLAMLSGHIPLGDIGTSDYADHPFPDLWLRCLDIMEDVVAARAACDYARFRHHLDLLFTALVDGAYRAQLEADRNTGLFSDNTHLFATVRGRLGENPGGAQEGDEIWVLAGLHAPIVLRHVGRGHRRVLGCAYVHGVMHGEAVMGGETEDVVLI